MATPSTEGYAPEWLEVEKTLGGRPLLEGKPLEIRKQYSELVRTIAAQSAGPDSSVQTRDISADGIPVRIYTPPNTSAGNPLPLGVYYHGGGCCVGDLDSEDPWCRYIAKTVPCVLVSVEYRLGPEYKMPVMLDDSLKAFEWARNHASELNANPAQVFTIGGSAGGCLSLTVANDLIVAGKKDHIQGIVSLVPVTAHPSSIPAAYKEHYKSYEENAAGVPILDRAAMDVFLGAIEADPHDERIFTTLSKHLDQFPPTYIATCGKDPLRDDGTVLEIMLKEKGIKTRSDFYDGVPHYFWMFPGMKGRDEFLDNVCAGVKFVLGI